MNSIIPTKKNINFIKKCPYYQYLNVFVYCGGKCGSSTLKHTFNKNGFKSIQAHSSYHFQVYFNVDMSLFDLIDVNKNNKIYFVDSYRLPIERKISSFFQNIHQHIPNYKQKNINELINFFNEKLLFPLEEFHSINEVMSHYEVPLFEKFDFERKYNIIENNNKIYIKMRFADINKWGTILSEIFGKKIILYSDNLTTRKSVNNLYNEFKKNYKVNKEYIYNKLVNDREFKIYNTPEEQEQYINMWLQKSY